MDAEVSRWARRGVGFGIGIVAAVALVTGAIASVKIVAMVLIAVLLASALGPIVDGVRSRAPFGRTGATGLLFLALGALLVGLCGVLVATAASQFDEIAARIPSAIASARISVANVQPARLAAALRAILDELDQFTRQAPQPSPDQVLLAGFTVLDTLGTVATILTMVFFWLHERARLQRFALSFVPQERRPGVRLAWNEVEERLGHWVRAQVTLMLLMVFRPDSLTPCWASRDR